MGRSVFVRADRFTSGDRRQGGIGSAVDRVFESPDRSVGEQYVHSTRMKRTGAVERGAEAHRKDTNKVRRERPARSD